MDKYYELANRCGTTPLKDKEFFSRANMDGGGGGEGQRTRREEKKRFQKVWNKFVKRSFPDQKEEASSGDHLSSGSRRLSQLERGGGEGILAAFGSGRDRRSFVIMSDTSSTSFAFKRRSPPAQPLLMESFRRNPRSLISVNRTESLADHRHAGDFHTSCQ